MLKSQKITKNNISDKKIAFISGFLGGLISINFIHKKNRSILGLFLITRGFECYYNKLINEKKIPQTWYNWVFIF